MDGRNTEKVTTVESRFRIHSTYRLCLHKGKKNLYYFDHLFAFVFMKASFLHLTQPAPQPDTIFLFLNLFFFFSIKLSGQVGDVCEPETVAQSMPPATQKNTRQTCKHPCAVVWWLGNVCQPLRLLLAWPAEHFAFLKPSVSPPPPFCTLNSSFGKTWLQRFPCNVSCNQMDGYGCSNGVSKWKRKACMETNPIFK